jgi:hypothetical protein
MNFQFGGAIVGYTDIQVFFSLMKSERISIYIHESKFHHIYKNNVVLIILLCSAHFVNFFELIEYCITRCQMKITNNLTYL